MSIKSKIIKVGICGVMVMVPLSQVSFPSFAAEEPGLKASQDVVNIPDPELKKQLNALMTGRAPDADITEAQMAGFQSIALSKGITDLTGLEYAKNVQTFMLTDVYASLEPIKNLSNMKNLTIIGENVTSSQFVDLSGLSSLENFTITNTKIDNVFLSKINNLPNLTTLNISYNLGITKVDTLKSLPKLAELNASFCQIDDFAGIEQFPSLTSFNGEQQRFEAAEFKDIKSSQLTFDAAAQTLFFPFSLLTKQTILNFDGTPLAFNTNAAEQLVETDSSYVLTDDKISVTQEGITFSGFTQADFDSLNVFYIMAMFDGANAAKPANLANGTYNIKNNFSIEGFNIDHSVKITAEDVSYVQGETVTPEQFLKDIKADANGAPITSDFAEKVDFSKPGTYAVTLNAENTAGLKGEPVQVTVTIIEKTVITAEAEVTYDMNATKSEADFLADIKAATNDGTTITTDFATAVDLTKAGEYTVTLNAENDKQKATALKVTVKVKDTTPTPDPDPTPTPDPDPTPTPDPDPTPTPDPKPSTNPGTAPAADPIYSDDSSSSVKDPSVKKSSDPILFFSASKAPKSTTKTLPKTGDSLPATGVVAGFLVLGLGVLIARKK
ncbi:internalin-like protein [Listeria monocytogenes]|uniref:LapB repeat-containing protein n=1 Tax=Listeria monocytogenes TaxID=1639 RepID=UPI0008757A82|nr:LapB repeat-containing protein [Listeria monocytogenes]EAC2403327.1 LPXTG cell wall anchor domain-containing protein [Listeria monocytogenes]EAE3631951.1 LPXTG cell wall anchor domain-containing protein [Listeria monocytogenes]EAE3682564.1 LPXTG cell wall anchor domain-containing protein [Listeria monocytogenes]EAF6546946.1 LPXTG cell wall anchor domain-containing protein [Listeria monocytogenes]EAK8931442.1 LPXTG cell wall anchor domain-containing protein [Listeria monocytogenes]